MRKLGLFFIAPTFYVLMTLRELKKKGIEALKKSGIDDAEADLDLIFFHFLSLKRSDVFLHGEEEVKEEDLKLIEDIVEKRKKRIPLQHLTGTQEFYGLPFKVNENVLIPRFDTEILVETVLPLLKPGDHILDLCTGSGCILLSILKNNIYVTGEGVDISTKALSVAKENKAFILSGDKDKNRASFYESDLFLNIDKGKKYDHIVSNPPYIKSKDIDDLMPEVRLYDPHIALDGGEDGLLFYKRIIREAGAHLFKNGTLSLEIGFDEGESVKALMEEKGFFDIKIIKDYGNNDRVLTAHI